MTEQGKLTEAEWRKRINASEHLTNMAIAALDSVGLIAPEVDPLLEEAEALHQEWIADDGDTITLALAALRRGMELRPELTRGRVRDGLRKLHWRTDDWAVETLFAALTDGGRDG